MPPMTRRHFLQAASASAAALTLAPLTARAADEKAAGFTLPKLPYAYDALEPNISAEIMKLHHDAHHQTYVTNLNKALEGHPDLLKKPIGNLLRDVDMVPEKIRQTVINNGGGHANHSMFWEIMGPRAGGSPTGELAKDIDAAFGSFDKFKDKLSTTAVARFGSGWGWLVLNKGKLEVISLANQDSPLLKGQMPIMGIDVWEHAYYLQYKQKRADYVKAWWNSANWKDIAERYAAAKKEA
ncbi:MAG: superoxide dismutase [Gemmataceae bacterium]